MLAGMLSCIFLLRQPGCQPALALLTTTCCATCFGLLGCGPQPMQRRHCKGIGTSCACSTQPCRAHACKTFFPLSSSTCSGLDNREAADSSNCCSKTQTMARYTAACAWLLFPAPYPKLAQDEQDTRAKEQAPVSLRTKKLEQF